MEGHWVFPTGKYCLSSDRLRPVVSINTDESEYRLVVNSNAGSGARFKLMKKN